jgi:hypothetical protein
MALVRVEMRDILHRALKMDSLLLRYFVVAASRPLKIDSLLSSCFVAFINRTEDGHPSALYPGLPF